MRKTSMARKRWCVECRFCQLRVDFDAGSHYFCGAEQRPLGADVLGRPACRKFQAPVQHGHWGP